MKYVIIDENKIPQHSLDKCYSLEEVKDYPNLAILVEEPFVVVDLDDNDEALALYDILKEFNIKCNIMKTDRGCHFWFKIREPLMNNTHINTPITVKIDIKSWGYNTDGMVKKSLVTIKRKNKWREWLVQEDDIAELPFWLTPMKLRKDLFGLGDGDGRDDGLFTYIIPLLKLKFTKPQIEVIFNIINKFIFKTPLLQREIDKMFKDNDIFDETLCFFDKKEFLHHEFAFWMKQSHPIEFFNGQLYLYSRGLYVPNSRAIEEIMIRKIPKLKTNHRNEVSKYLELICTNLTNPIQPLWINTLSGIYDIENKKLIPHSDKIFSINQIKAYCNIGFIDSNTDTFLNSISSNNKEIRLLLEEIIGYCLINDCRFQKAFILLGAGANGKSVFLKMLTEFLGEENVSSIPLEELNGKFESAELVGKLANIADDISSEFLQDSSTFKKLVTGDNITAQRKFGHPFQFNNVSKLLFSANTLPPVSDKSFGLHRRLVIVPFLRTYTIGDKDYDPNILTKLRTEYAKTYLLNLGIQGIERLIQNNGFTIPNVVEEMLDDYIKDNNNCVQWLEDKPELDEREIKEVYREYCMFCLSNGTKPYKKARFTTEILNKLPYIKVKNTTKNGQFIQVFSEYKKRTSLF